MEKPVIQAVLFDKDGTLFDLARTWAGWCDAFLAEIADSDPTQMDRLAQLLGYDRSSQSFVSGALAVNATAEDINQVLAAELGLASTDGLHAIGERLARDLPDLPIPGLEASLRLLRHQGMRLGVATNDYASVAHQQLQRTGLDQWFCFVAGFDSGFGGKPGPGMVLAFCEHLGLQPDQVAMVGDSTHDLRAGRAARVGLNVAVLTGSALFEDLAPFADAVLPDVTHLEEFLRR